MSSKKTILVIDDDNFIRDSLIEMLKTMNSDLKIISAEHGIQGLHILKSENPDAIFVDYNMPFMDGVQFLKTLHSSKKLDKYKVVMMSAELCSAEDKLSEEIKLDAKIKKPFNLSRIEKLLKEI